MRGARLTSLFTVQNVVGPILLMLLQLHLSLQCGVEMVLDVVISSAREIPSNLGPSVTKFPVRINDKTIFFFGPLVLFDVRIQMIVPSKIKYIYPVRCYLPLSALLANPTWKGRSYLTPVLGPVLLNHVNKHLVLLIGPGPFDHCWVKNLLPSVKALDISAVVKEGCNSLPVLCL